MAAQHPAGGREERSTHGAGVRRGAQGPPQGIGPWECEFAVSVLCHQLPTPVLEGSSQLTGAEDAVPVLPAQQWCLGEPVVLHSHRSGHDRRISYWR